MSRAWITTDPDGRTRYRFHQSWLSDTDLCLERARAGLMEEYEDGPNDATSVGTGMHFGIEQCVNSIIEHDEPLSVDDTVRLAFEEWERQLAEPGFRWVKRKTRKAAESYLTMCTENWWERIMPKLQPVATEVSFGPYVLYEDERIVIEIGGTIDYVDMRGLGDWKTGSAHGWSGKDWEKQRWSIQATTYTFAYDLLAQQDDRFPRFEIPIPFNFFVMLDNNATQIVRTVRRPEDWNWLRRKVLAVVRQIEVAGLEGPWPVNDQHALCSPKWCPLWAACKGQDVHVKWPK